MSSSKRVRKQPTQSRLDHKDNKKKKDVATDLEKARNLNENLHGHRSFKRSRGSQIPKEIFGNCPDVAQRYEKIGRLGEGTYGVVYKARDKQTNQIVALKRCLPHFENTDGFPVTTLREISLLRSLQYGYGKHPHPSIVQLLDVAVSSIRRTAVGNGDEGNGSGGSGVFLVFEYCEYDLAQLVDEHYASHAKSPFTEAEVKHLAQQLLKGLDFLHSRNIMHRDIKLSNLLYSQSKNGNRSHLRIADFGLARKSNNSFETTTKESKSADTMHTPKVVSLWYRPPELLFESGTYTEAIDNWGAGCAIAELLDGQPLLKGCNEMDQIRKLFELLGPPNSRIWPKLSEMPLVRSNSVKIPPSSLTFSSGTSLLDRFDSLSSDGLTLLTNLLQYDYEKRWTSSQALKSNYFEENPLPSCSDDMPIFDTNSKRTKSVL